MRTAFVASSLLCLNALLLTPAPASAQVAGSGGIAGIARDTTGAVLPGVTVEAASPALIEKVRSVVTDNQGQYKIVDLRPGLYSVTFSLPGFSTTRREGIELTPSFTASINAEMRIGSVEETITVTSQSPLVDVLRAEARNVISADRLEALPTNKTLPAFVALTPGLTAAATSQDVGGTKGEVFIQPAIHGGHATEARTVLDGFETNSPDVGGSGRVFVPNPAAAQAVSVELGDGPGEAASSGVAFNFVPRDGGNTFKGTFIGNFSHDKLQGTNLNDEVRARGLTETSIGGLDKLWDASFGLGGPIDRDRLRFFSAHRHWGSANRVPNAFYNATPESLFFTADTSRPALDDFTNRSHNVRLTWQASRRNKITGSYDWEYRCDCHRSVSATLAPEATAARLYHASVTAVTWNFPATNRLLLEAGSGTVRLDYSPTPQDDVPLETISILESSNNLRYRAVPPSTGGSNGLGQKYSLAQNWRFSGTYVTGSHAFKAGMTLRQMTKSYHNDGSAISYTFNNREPTSISLYAYPLVFHEVLKGDLGVFVQDQWTIRRLTLNMALRYDYFNAYVPAQQHPAGPYVPVRDFGQVDCAPCWQDISPRLSAAYNLFGNGKTALKVSVGRYMAQELLDLAALSNPITVSNATANRSWTDANRDLIPQESELGGLTNPAFGTVRITTRYADDVLRENRGNNWKTSVALQHELRPRLGANLAYYRTSWYNFRETDNLALLPSDYDPYSIVAPLNPRLPDGGGYLVTGLYNISNAGFAKTPDNLVTESSHFGEQREDYDGIDLTINARLPQGAFIGGGLNTGRTIADSCYVIDSPQALRYCRVEPPFRTQVKLNGSYNLPWDLRASAVFQSLPGIPISASYVAQLAEVQPSLGRPLSGGARTVTIPTTMGLIEPQTQFEDRLNQLDVRFARSFRLRNARIQATFDIYNMLNATSILAINTAFGTSWLTPTAVLDARLVKFGLQVDF